jgi:hypothetical protein
MVFAAGGQLASGASPANANGSSQAASSGAAGTGTSTPSSGGSQGNSGSQGGAGQSGQGTTGGTGTGAGSGSGSGNGSGNGNGSGSGTGSGSGGYGQGAGLGEGHHELVAVPSRRLDGTGGPVETVGGALGQGTSETRNSATSQVTSGTVRPYAEVYQQYEKMSRESLQRSNIPSDYQNMVRDYFRRIEP